MQELHLNNYVGPNSYSKQSHNSSHSTASSYEKSFLISDLFKLKWDLTILLIIQI